MTRWTKTINIKPLITGDSSDESAKRCATGIKALLVERVLDYDFDFQVILDDLEAVETCQDVNYTLDALYDWADANNVWLGLLS